VSLRLLTFAALLAALVTITVMSARLSHSEAASLPQGASQGTSQNKRKLVRSKWRGEPVQVNKLKLRGRMAEFGKAFTEADDDWLKGFSLNVTNTSNKDIVFIELTLTFFGKEEGLTPSRIPLGYPVFYGSPEGIFDGSNTARPIRPNESVDVTLTDADHDTMKEVLLNNNYPIRFRHVDLRLDKVVFADGTVWYKSYYFYRDPNNPRRYIRDKHFQKVQSTKS
jgi:hypothetical protein